VISRTPSPDSARGSCRSSTTYYLRAQGNGLAGRPNWDFYTDPDTLLQYCIRWAAVHLSF
jgi:hypothetical protein